MTPREALEQQIAQLQFELGGLVYEMAIRDHFRLDTLVRRAAQLQELEDRLAALDAAPAAASDASADSADSAVPA